MKRTNAKKLSIFLLFILVTGCTPSFDASAYIKACLDANTHGEFAEYADITKTSVEEVEALYNKGIDTEISYLDSYNISDEKREEFRALFVDIYKSFKYEVGEAVRNDDDSYSVPVTTYKLQIFKDIMSEGEAYLTDYAQKEVDAGRTPTQEQLEEEALNYMYDTMKANLGALEYGEAVTITVTVSPSQQNSQTVYSVGQADLQTLLKSFIDIENAQ